LRHIEYAQRKNYPEGLDVCDEHLRQVLAQPRLSRQALYQVGDYSLDLRLENERGTSRVALVGQIQNHQQPGNWLGGLPILLVSGKQILAQAVSNSLGESQMEYAPTKRLRLYAPSRRLGPESRPAPAASCNAQLGQQKRMSPW